VEEMVIVIVGLAAVGIAVEVCACGVNIFE